MDDYTINNLWLRIRRAIEGTYEREATGFEMLQKLSILVCGSSWNLTYSGIAHSAETWWIVGDEEIDQPWCAVDNEEAGVPRLLLDGHHSGYPRISKHQV